MCRSFPLCAAILAALIVAFALTIDACIASPQGQARPVSFSAGGIVSDTGLIAFTTKPNDFMTEIWTVNGDGVERRVVSLLGTVVKLGPWLPGQDTLSIDLWSLLWTTPDDAARTANSGSGSPIIDNQTILLAAATRAIQPLKLPDGYEAIYTAFGPDPNMIAFTGYHTAPGQGDMRDSGVWLYDRRAGKLTRLLTGALKTAPAWSPDGAHVAISAAEGYTNNHRLVLVDVPSGVVHDLGINGAGASFSPDGSRLAYSGDFKSLPGGSGSWMDGVPATGGLFVVALPPGGAPVQVSAGDDGATRPRWSPDGTRLAYVTSDNTVIVVDATGARRHPVFRNGTDVKDVAWDPTGKFVLISSIERDFKPGVYRTPADFAVATRLDQAAAEVAGRQDSNDQGHNAEAALKEAVYRYAVGFTREFEGSPEKARESWLASADLFSTFPAKFPQCALAPDNAVEYAQKATDLARRSDDAILEEACTQRMEFLHVAIDAAAADHRRFPPDLASALSWAYGSGWEVNWLRSDDRPHVMELSSCPGSSRQPAASFVYTGPVDGSEPRDGDVIVRCPLHPDEKLIWGKDDAFMIRRDIMRGGKPGAACKADDDLDLPYWFENAGQGALTITRNVIGDTYTIKGSAQLLPSGKLYSDATISLGETDEGSVARKIDSGIVDWGDLAGDDLKDAKDALEFCRAVAQVEAGKPITRWKEVYGGEPARLLYKGDPGGACVAYSRNAAQGSRVIKFDLCGPGAIELSQVEPSGRFHVVGVVRVAKTGKTCSDCWLDKDGNWMASLR